nr:unnamed protein product [Callosobruchus analis]
MYPDGTNRHYTIKKMFNRSNAENAEIFGKRNASSLDSHSRHCLSCVFVLGTVLYALLPPFLLAVSPYKV